MKILQIGKYYPPYRGGMETVLENLFEGLLDAGVQVNTLVSGTDTTDRLEVVRSTKSGREGGLVRAATAGQLNSQPLSTTFLSLLRRQLDLYPPDLVHLHLPNPLAVLAWTALARWRGDRMPPLAIWHHADITRQRVGAKLVRPLVRSQFNRCAGLCVSTKSLAENSRCLQGFPGTIEIIPFGIEPEPWTLIKPAREGPLLFIGRLVPYKGLRVLLDAMKLVPGGRLDVVGEGPLKSILETEVIQGCLAGRVTFHGSRNQEELVSLMSRARALVLPSLDHSETFGLVQLEAMASGVPVIASNLSTGVAQVGIEGKTCLLVPPGDVPKLAGVLKRVLEDEQLVQSLGENSRARFLKEFTRDAMVSRVLAWYRMLLLNEPPKGNP